jgi:ketosteroid isomerase-like protein
MDTDQDAGRGTRNAEAVRSLLAAVNSGDTAGFLAGLAEEVVYEAPYYAHFGERRGRAAIEDMLGAMAERFCVLRYDIVEFYPTVDEDLVIVECRGDNVLVGSDRHYRNHYLLFIDFTPQGLARRWREFSNPDVYRREAEGG